MQQEIAQQIKERLVDVYQPVAIFLFGSQVWGKPAPDSDIDVLVVVGESSEPFHKRPLAGYRALYGIRNSVDLLVYSREEFMRLSEDPSSLFYRIRQDGLKLYEAA